MTFATFTNLVLMVLCSAVLVQSLRMTRALNLIRNSDLKDMIEGLCTASAEAQIVLTRLKGVLNTDAATHTRTVARGEAMLTELTLMVDIANAAAERIVDVAESHRPAPPAEPAPAVPPAAKVAPKKRKAAPRPGRAASRTVKKGAAA